jgi:HPt (histidine-containing phosphotransfer) domain-containing protein
MPRFVDLTNFHEITGRDKDLERELFFDFIEKSQENLEAMRTAMKTQDKIVWRENAHMMKGACKSLGAFILADLMEQAQDCASEEKNGLYHKILASFDEVRHFLTQEMKSAEH